MSVAGCGTGSIVGCGTGSVRGCHQPCPYIDPALGYGWTGHAHTQFPFPRYPAPTLSPEQYQIVADGCDQPLPQRNVNRALWELCFDTPGLLEIAVFGEAANVRGNQGPGIATMGLTQNAQIIAQDFVQGNINVDCVGRVARDLAITVRNDTHGNLNNMFYVFHVANSFYRPGGGPLICCGEGSLLLGLTFTFTPD